jgi:hypothetical protein
VMSTTLKVVKVVSDMRVLVTAEGTAEPGHQIVSVRLW